MDAIQLSDKLEAADKRCGMIRDKGKATEEKMSFKWWEATSAASRCETSDEVAEV